MKQHLAGVAARVIAAFCVTVPAHAAFFDNSAVEPNEYYQEGDPWQELDSVLPALPREDDLLKIEFPSASSNDEFIDARSLELGEDGITRVSLVTRHKGGAETVTHEGIRCQTAQYRIYAIKNGDVWMVPKTSEWRDIPLGRYKTLRTELYSTVLCKDGLPKKTDKIVKDIRYPPDVRNW